LATLRTTSNSWVSWIECGQNADVSWCQVADLLRCGRCLYFAEEGGAAFGDAASLRHSSSEQKPGFGQFDLDIWFKIANGVTEAEGNGAGFYGKPYQPGAIIKNDFETILF